MDIRFKKAVLGLTFLWSPLLLSAQQGELSKAIEEQVMSAADCQQLAYGVKLKNFDADQAFKDCVERRAILIAMLKKYGPGKMGEIDIIEKLEAYSYLADSNNDMVQQEANRHMTAAGR